MMGVQGVLKAQFYVNNFIGKRRQGALKKVPSFPELFFVLVPASSILTPRSN